MADGSGKKEQSWASNRIKHALHLPGWVFKRDSEAVLRSGGRVVLVSEYEAEMKGDIFCPECSCPLFRSPEREDANKRGKNAYYGHRRNIVTECGLRTKQAEGKRYASEEDAAQAVVDGKLVIIESFLKARPVSPEKDSETYDETAVEDQDGQMASVPIARHRGVMFSLPSKVTTVRGLCTNFDKNLYKYFFLPGAQHAQLLNDALRDVDTLFDVTAQPILGYGQIVGIYDPGKYGHNIRFIRLKFGEKEGYGDFSIMLSRDEADAHDLNLDSIGRFAMFYGRIRENGSGLSVKGLGWGEVSLVPKKYESYLSNG